MHADGGCSIYKSGVAEIAAWGGNAGVLTFGQHQYWRLLTSMFVHGGIIHLLMNMVGFIFVAFLLERSLGRKWFLLLYLTTGIVAGACSALWYHNIVSAGASGAIFGLYGFMLGKLVFVNRKQRSVNAGGVMPILIFVGYNLLSGIGGRTDNAAHIGGLACGFFLVVIAKIWKGLFRI